MIKKILILSIILFSLISCSVSQKKQSFIVYCDKEELPMMITIPPDSYTLHLGGACK
jgi:hypothetical protein